MPLTVKLRGKTLLRDWQWRRLNKSPTTSQELIHKATPVNQLPPQAPFNLGSQFAAGLELKLILKSHSCKQRIQMQLKILKKRLAVKWMGHL